MFDLILCFKWPLDKGWDWCWGKTLRERKGLFRPLVDLLERECQESQPGHWEALLLLWPSWLSKAGTVALEELNACCTFDLCSHWGSGMEGNWRALAWPFPLCAMFAPQNSADLHQELLRLQGEKTGGFREPEGVFSSSPSLGL